MANWTAGEILRQSGRLAVVTGAAGGLGFESALALAAAGAHVVLTVATLTNVRRPSTQAECAS